MRRIPLSPPPPPRTRTGSGAAIALLTAAAVLGASLVVPARARAGATENIDSYLSQLRLCPGTKIPGLAMVVVRDDPSSGPTVVYSSLRGVRDATDESDPPVTEDTIFNLGSMTTTFTAIVLGTLVDDGLLAWEDRIAERLPELAGWLDDLGRADLTIADLLTHHVTLYPEGFLAPLDLLPDSHGIGDFARLSFPHFEPSGTFREEFEYNSWPFTVAAAIAEEVTGESWDDLVASRFVVPLGLEDYHLSTRGVLDDRPDEYTHLHGLLGSGQIESLPRDMNTRFDGPARPGAGALLDLATATQVLLAMADGFSEILAPETWHELTTAPVRSLQPVSLRIFNPFNLWIASHSMGALTGYYRGGRVHFLTGTGIGVSNIVVGFPDDGLYMLFLSNMWRLPSSSRLFLALYARDELVGVDSRFSPSKVCALSSVSPIQPPFYQNLEAVFPVPNEWPGTYSHPLYGELTITLTADDEAELSLGPQAGLVRRNSQNEIVWSAETGYAEPVGFTVGFPAGGDQVTLGLREPQSDAPVTFTRTGSP